MNVEIADRLARRRREAGYSQESLAERLGVTRQAVSKWERSESSPDTDNLIGLAKLYGVSLDELLNVDPSIADDVAFEVADKASKESFAFSDNSLNLTDGDGSTLKINWHDGVHIKDGKTGEEVRVGWSGIHINEKGSGAAAWCNADDEDFSNAHLFDREGWDNVKGKYKAALKFPIYLLVIIAYLLMGFLAPPLVSVVGSISPWAYGIFLIAIIPTYYMLIYAIASKSAVRFIQGFYPLACLVFFLWMWFVIGIPHPTWVVLLTVPIVEWICASIRKGQRRRHKATVEDGPGQLS